MSYIESLRFWVQDTVQSYVHKYGTRIIYAALVGVALIAAGLLGWFSYRWYIESIDGKAQMVLEQCLTEYQKALFEDPARQDQVIDICTTAFQAHKTSNYGPYFLQLIADLQAMQGKHEQALQSLESAIALMKTTNPLYYLAKTKLALLMFDIPSKIEQGRALLEELASDSANAAYDMALYYLGLSYWHNQDIEKARQLWQPLVDLAQGQEDSDSVWAMLAAHKIESLKRIALPDGPITQG